MAAPPRPRGSQPFYRNRRGTVNLARLDGGDGPELAVADSLLSHRVEEIEIAFFKRENGDVRLGAFAERSQTVEASEDSGRILGHALDGLLQGEPKVQELRKRRGQIEHRVR